MKYFFFIIFILSIINGQAQELIDISNHNDCEKALKIFPVDTFGPTTAPSGFGNLLEFKDNPKFSTQYIENEHHTVWYKFKMPYSAYLSFDIIPLQITDDYDFMFFKYDDSNFCNKIVTKEIEPVRAIISRNDQTIESKTGLSTTTLSKYVHRGPGDSYAESYEVKKGETYYLLVDNVYENGKGHSISFQYRQHVVVKGDIMDHKTSFPVNALIKFKYPEIKYDIISVNTIGKTGFFSTNLPLDLNDSMVVEISVFAEGYFFKDTLITVENIKKSEGKRFVFNVEEIKVGERINLEKIHFEGNLAVAIPSSYRVFDNLYELMLMHPTLHIRLEGHTDGCRGGLKYSQDLSEARTRTIKNYLVSKGIDKNRISTRGYNCQKMIYAEPKNEYQEQMNRRVEVYIAKY